MFPLFRRLKSVWERKVGHHTHTHTTRLSLGFQFFSMCLSMEPLSLCFSPFEPEKWENEGVKENRVGNAVLPKFSSFCSQVGHGRRREEAVHDGLSPPTTTTPLVRLLRNWWPVFHLSLSLTRCIYNLSIKTLSLFSLFLSGTSQTKKKKDTRNI